LGYLIFIKNNGVFRANAGAIAAFYTKIFNEPDFRARGNTFGVGTPSALQAAAFKEYYGPYTRPVMNGKTLYVGDETGHKTSFRLHRS
jgi:hypothetical protein